MEIAAIVVATLILISVLIVLSLYLLDQQQLWMDEHMQSQWHQVNQEFTADVSRIDTKEPPLS